MPADSTPPVLSDRSVAVAALVHPSARVVSHVDEPEPSAISRSQRGHDRWQSDCVPEPQLATNADIATWIEIVREVEPLFGAMPTFDQTLGRAIARSGAWCIRVEDTVAAGMILSRPEEAANINWLAVRQSQRGRGFGRDLVGHALRVFSDADEVTVDTFGEDNIDGRSARRLYESFGFIAGDALERGPEGGTRQRYRLKITRSDPSLR